MLSAFDGVGAAPWLVWDLIGEPRAIFAWEVDRAAIQVADYHIPGIRRRGDITEDTPEDLAAEIQHIDGQAECIIIFTAAPPCQDFSRVGDRDGHAGSRGYLFNFTAEFIDELRRRLAPRRFGFLVENVEMTPADAAEASKQLGCQPTFADAADFGWIGRPRLWWSSVDWDEITHDPSTAERWTWVLHRRWDRLRLDSPRAAPDSFDLDGLKFSDAVASGRIRLPCSTTPAADERGRPPPRSMRGKVTTEVQQRWLQDSRQFAPWHYQRDAMLTDDQGKLVVLTPSAKEQLHHMPKNFAAVTAQGDLEPRTRHRLLGNGWHWGVARRFLLAVLVHAAASLPTTAAIPTTPPTSTIQWVAALWGPAGPPMGPAPAKPTLEALQELDEEAHWQASWALEHPLAKPPPLEPAWERLLELRRRWRHDIVRIRREVLAEVHLLIDDLEEESRSWMAARPSWVRATYSTPDKPAPTRVLAFLELLRRLGYPDMAAITEDMTDGFQMLGEIRPGPGWRRREDGKYQNPVPIADLVATNADYVRRKVHTARVGEHSEKLLHELIAEKRLGRVIGPTRPPEWLRSVKATAVADHQDVDIIAEPPPGDAFLAASFPVCQTDENGELKVRRAEDWRRSGHNSTVSVADVPTHHFVGSFVDLARRMAHDRRRLVVFGHDLLNAYRQWPVRRPAHCGTFLATKHGVTFWFHLAMNFGATASVWNFNRAADALQQLLRGLLLTPTGHYVDDFNGVEDDDLGESAADGFQDLFAALGFLTKKSKAQPPANEHVVQGVTFHIDEHGVTLSPTPRRVEKILAQLRRALHDDSLSPDDASRLAGRVAFLTQSVFGAVARAATKAIYARAADTAAWSNDSLSPGLAAALKTLVNILPTTRPRFVPFNADQLAMAVLYADAFFTDGERRHKAGHVPDGMNPSPHQRAANGWGYVLRIGDRVFYDHGVVPPWFVKLFAARRAYIYMLEVFAQIIAFAAFAKLMPPTIVAFIDNTAGQAALTKGYGKDAAVNGMISAFWTLAARRGWFVEFERVPSKANVADAVSRDDFTRARREGWIRVNSRDDEVMAILAKAVGDIEFANTTAAEELILTAGSTVLD